MERIMSDPTIGLTQSGRRAFPVEYRLEFLRKWDAGVQRGAKVRLLREHALAASTVKRWLAARASGDLTASMVARAERSSHRMENRDRAELARLLRENEALKKKVAQSEAAQQILGKAFELLEGITTSSDNPPEIPPMLMSADEYAQWLKQHRLS
jgi:hypothetical protein